MRPTAPAARPPVGNGETSGLPLPVWEQIERLAVSDEEKAALPYRRTSGLGRRRLVDVVRRRGGVERAQHYLQRVAEHTGRTEAAFTSAQREPLRPVQLGLEASAARSRTASTAAVAAGVDAAFGGRRYRFVYEAPSSGLSVDTVSSWSPDGERIVSSTVDLHGATAPDGGIELAMMSRSTDDFVISALALAAFSAMRGEQLADGVVTDDAVGDFYVSTTTPHLLWSARTPWPELGSVEIPLVGTVSWLFGWPITEAEREAAIHLGGAEVASRLSDAGADPTDLWRASIVDAR